MFPGYLSFPSFYSPANYLDSMWENKQHTLLGLNIKYIKGNVLVISKNSPFTPDWQCYVLRTLKPLSDQQCGKYCRFYLGWEMSYYVISLKILFLVGQLIWGKLKAKLWSQTSQIPFFLNKTSNIFKNSYVIKLLFSIICIH